MSTKDWPELYADYLKSQEWADRRERVLRRAGYRCEGCQDRPANEVHHLTYDHWGNEFLFELVAMCGECHSRWHGHPTRPKAPTWTPRHKNSGKPTQVESPGARASRDRLAALAAQHRLKPMPGETDPQTTVTLIRETGG